MFGLAAVRVSTGKSQGCTGVQVALIGLPANRGIELIVGDYFDALGVSLVYRAGVAPTAGRPCSERKVVFQRSKDVTLRSTVSRLGDDAP